MGFLYSVDMPDQEGDRLDDLGPAPIGYGNVIPEVKGMRRVTGQLLAQFPIVETVHEEEVDAGGKGGGSTSYTNTTYTYSCTFAVLLSAHQIAGVKRIWLNSKVFYENGPYQFGDVAKARENAEAFFNVYHGTDTQRPDPILAAKYGSKCPAYRGRAYIVFQDLQLAEFGNRIPQVDVEVVENGTGSTYDTVYPYPVYLRDVVGDICVRAGVPANRLDVTQLSDVVEGFARTSDNSGLSALKPLAEMYNFYPSEAGDKLVFKKDPSPVLREEHAQPCIINEDGLIVNAYHDTLGRQGYFPAEAGTSEGQFVMIRAAALAYQQTGSDTWLSLLETLARGVDNMYGQPPPGDSDTLYTPHWLFNVKRPVAAQSNKLNVKVKFARTGDEYVGTIPASYPEYGESVKDVTLVYSDDASFVSWFNPYAGVIGTDYGRPSSFTASPAGCEVRFPVDRVADSPAFVECNLMVIYNFGPLLNVSQNLEAWPHWRPLDPGELDCAVDTLPWAYEAFELLHEVTGEQQYADAMAATAASVYKVYDVDDGRGWIRKINGGPLRQSGTYVSTTRSGFSEGAITRTRDLHLFVDIAEGEGEAQYGRGITDFIRAGDTHIGIDYAFTPTADDAIPFDYDFDGGEGVFDAAAGLTQALKDATEPGGMINRNLSLYLKVFLQNGLDVGTAVRYFYLLPAGDGMAEISLDAFIPMRLTPEGWEYDSAAPVPGAGMSIDVVGIIYDGEAPATYTLRSFRPYPVVRLPYTPDIAPYTANSFNGSLIDWRGAPGVGYQDPTIWARLNEPDHLEGMLDFLADSQAEYNNRYGNDALFIPAFTWDRFDMQATGAQPGDWTFDWVDPNSEWVGYTARVIAACADAGAISGNNRALGFASRFITWLGDVWTDSGRFIPTNFPESIPEITRNMEVPANMAATVYNGFIYRADEPGYTNPAVAPDFPTVLGQTVYDGGVKWRCAGYTYGDVPVFGDYDEPHAASLFMRAAAVLYQEDTRPLESLTIVTRCWLYIRRLWRDSSGDLNGTWSHNSEAGEWFGFWSGEIVTTLSRLLGDLNQARAAANISKSEIREMLAIHAEWLADRTRSIDVAEFDDVLTESDFSQVRVRESELPRRLELEFPSSKRGGADDTRYAEKRGAKSEEVETMKSPVALTGDEALAIVQRGLLKLWSQRDQYKAEIFGRQHQPGDVREYVIDGVVRRLQFVEVTNHPDGFAEVEAVSYDPAAFTLTAPVSGDPRRSVGVSVVASTNGILLDIPLYDDSLNSAGFTTYGVPTGSNWRGGALLSSPDDGAYTKVAPYTTKPVYGTCLDVLPVKSPELRDEVSEVRVSLQHGQLSSVSEDAFLLGTNKALIGGEVVYFRNAVLDGDGFYVLSGFLRGRRGTRPNVYGHTAGERFVLLSGPGLVDATVSADLIGTPLYFKSVSVGQTEADVTPVQTSINAVRLKPIAPAHLRIRRFTDRAVLDWKRSTRLSADWRDGVDAPLGEGSERYRVHLRDGYGGVNLASWETTSDTLTITSDEIESAYGSATAKIIVAVCQVSETVGDGFYIEDERA